MNQVGATSNFAVPQGEKIGRKSRVFVEVSDKYVMDMRSLTTRILLAVMLLSSGFLVGCSVDGQITDGTVKVYNPSMAQLSGFVSGSYQNVVTASGYKVSASLGSPFSEPVENKTNGGYTVYSSIQGNINSETYDIIRQ